MERNRLKYCDHKMGGREIVPVHTIHLCPGAFNDPAACGELPCTVLHEMTHAGGTGDENEAQRSEICSGMNCVTEPGIKVRDMSKAPAHISPCWDCGTDD